jgi:hypothetical protein
VLPADVLAHQWAEERALEAGRAVVAEADEAVAARRARTSCAMSLPTRVAEELWKETIVGKAPRGRAV